MPTDGTLLLEHMPNGKQYLLTALSVFFSLGAVMSALVGIVIIPRYSCQTSNSTPPCLPESNMGWKYMLIILGLLVRIFGLAIVDDNFLFLQTLLMFFARVMFFRLHESPRYLVHAGRPHDAVMSLRKISEFNGDDLTIGLSNVEDRTGPVLFATEDTAIEALDSISRRPNRSSGGDDPTAHAVSTLNSVTNSPLNYHSTASTPSSPIYTGHEGAVSSSSRIDGDSETETDPFFSAPEPKTALSNAPARPLLASFHSQPTHGCSFVDRLPSWARGPLSAWLGRLAMVLSKEWRSTTLLVWWIWFAISLGAYC